MNYSCNMKHTSIYFHKSSNVKELLYNIESKYNTEFVLREKRHVKSTQFDKTDYRPLHAPHNS